MAKQLSDEWLAADLALWNGKEPVKVPPAYLRMLIREIQRQREEKIELLAKAGAAIATLKKVEVK